jgi:cystathionine beta-lyase/cystathionine gamma-synthase
MSRRPSRHSGFSTRAIHAGQDPEPTTGAVVTPISLSTTFAQDGVGNHKGFEYSRSGNPTRSALEAQVASLEDAATASRSPAGSPPRTTSCGCCDPASGSCSATTPTAARSA